MSADRMSRFVNAVGRIVPDALTSSIVMLVLLALVAWLLGNAPTTIADGYYRVVWMLLPFAMQMTLRSGIRADFPCLLAGLRIVTCPARNLEAPGHSAVEAMPCRSRCHSV